MKCDICGRTENEFMEKFIQVVESFKKQVGKIDEEIQGVKENYANENGFTKENFEKVRKIDKNILQMKINAFLGNKESFLKLEPELEILHTYLTKYRPQIGHENLLQNLSEMFLSEPNESRFSRQISEIKVKKDTLIMAMEIIKNKNGLFFEIEIPFSAFEFEHKRRFSVEDVIRKYYENGNELVGSKKIILCHYCSYLFKKASEAAYQVIHAHDNDWDDFGE